MKECLSQVSFNQMTFFADSHDKTINNYVNHIDNHKPVLMENMNQSWPGTN